MSRVTRRYTDSRFGQIHYLESGPSAPQAPTLLLLHQNPSSSVEYLPIMAAIGDDRHVIAFDTPGYGMSDPPPAPPTMAGYAAVFADALTALGLTGQGAVDVFGFHTGALLAIELALACPRAVGRIVVSGIPMRPAAERAERLREARATPPPTDDGAAVLARSAALWRYVVAERSPAVPLDRAVTLYAEKNRTLHRSWWAYDGVWSYDFARLAQVTQPTLVLQPHDALLDVSRDAAALIRGARFVAMPEFGRDFLDVGAGAIAAELRRFLVAYPETLA